MLSKYGQTLIEILVALAVFVLVLSVVFMLVGSHFLNSRQAQGNALALWLTEEGLEASRAIRDNNWDDLASGNHGLAIVNNHWVFSGLQEDISPQLNQGTRQVQITDLNQDRKMITTEISWPFSPSRNNQVTLTTIFSNWQAVNQSSGICQGTPLLCNAFSEALSCQDQSSCLWSPAVCRGACRPCSSLSLIQCLGQADCRLILVGKTLRCRGNCLSCDNFSEQTTCEGQLGCSWQPGFCSGAVVLCEDFSDQPGCETQQGCQWISS